MHNMLKDVNLRYMYPIIRLMKRICLMKGYCKYFELVPCWCEELFFANDILNCEALLYDSMYIVIIFD